MEPSSEERILAGFSHLMIIFGWYGTAAALAIWLVKRNKSEFIKNSVKQAVVYQILALGILHVIGYMEGPRIALALTAHNVPGASEILGVVLVMTGLGLFLYGVAGAAANFKGKSFKYFLIGDLIDKFFN